MPPKSSNFSVTGQVSSPRPRCPKPPSKFELSDANKDKSLPNSRRESPVASSPPAAEPHHESCFPLLGALSPFLGDVCLREVGASSLPGDAWYIIWRIFILLGSIVTIVLTAVDNVRFLAYTQGAAAGIGLFAHAVLLRRAWAFRKLVHDIEVLWTPHIGYSLDAFVVQTAMQLSFTVPIVYAVNGWLSSTGVVLSPGSYVGSAGSLSACVLAILQVVDVLLTPVPFRATHILPAVLYCETLSGISMWATSRTLSIAGLLLIAVGSLAVGLVIHFFSRAVLLYIHKPRIIAELQASMGFTQRGAQEV